MTNFSSEMLFSFEGSIPRSAWWINKIVIALITMAMVMLIFMGIDNQIFNEQVGFLGILIVYVVLFWVNLALDVKRWHDRGKSGWWELISFVPLIGPPWMLIELGFLAGEQ